MNRSVARVLKNWPDRLDDPDTVLHVVTSIMATHHNPENFWEKELARITLEQTSGNITRAAARLNVCRKTLGRKIKIWGLK